MFIGSNRRPTLSFANVVACLALFVALGGSAYAVGKGQVKSRHIATEAVKSKHLRDGGVKSRDIRDGQITDADLGRGSVRGEHLDLDCAEGLTRVGQSCFTGAFLPTDLPFAAGDHCGELGGRLPGVFELRAARRELNLPPSPLWTDDYVFGDQGLQPMVVSSQGGVSVSERDVEYSYVCITSPLSSSGPSV